MIEGASELIACVERLERRHGLLTVEVVFPVAITIIANIQLALRHPGNRGPSADNARAFVDKLIATLEASEPRIGPLLRRGFDKSFDVAVD